MRPATPPLVASLAGALCALAWCGAAPPAKAPVVLFTPASAVPPALADVKTLPESLRPQARYVSAYDAPEEDLPGWEEEVRDRFNGWSRNGIVVAPAPVKGAGGRLWRVVLSDYRIPPRAYDRLIALGSGRVPVPEPYFRFVAEDAGGAPARPRKTLGGLYAAVPRVTGGKAARKFVALQPPWLPKKELAELIAETGSEFCLARLDWVSYYGMLEPRYHELLGLDDTEESFRRLAGAGGVKDADETVELGSVVLDSEVAVNNRALFREAVRNRHGRGYWWESRDFDKSVGVDDVLADPSAIKAKAKEVIFSLPNGLQGYGVFDAAGKRLDRAGIEFAHDGRNGFRSVEVEIRNCPCCHAQGLIPVEDEVRGYSGDQLALGLRLLKKRDAAKAAFVADRFFSADINTVLAADQQSYAGAVMACNGAAPAANALRFRKHLLRHERTLSLEDLPRETGFPPVVVLGVLERAAPTGLDHSAARLAQRKRPGKAAPKARRDQYEAAAHGQLMTLLSRVPVEAPPPAARGGKRVAGKE